MLGALLAKSASRESDGMDGAAEDRVRDISNTVAFTYLDDMLRAGKITQETADALKAKYKKLHEVRERGSRLV